ncbi:MAG: histidine phosphatase family protein [Streptococcaceae bacterium]|jgi:2,3-bisphosphoglycerate-dependent phosphoglycerate mutase|nr:histidine phosphatase family protein [Streptococcaceae bacterium]
MTTIYFIRHSERDTTVQDDDFGAPLTEEGHARSEALVAVFENIVIDAIFSSPYKRTMDTVFPLAISRQLEIQTSPDLRERETGVWLDDFEAYAAKQWADFDYKLETGESLNEVQTRNISALKAILCQFKTESIIIGTHGTALSTILNYYDKNFGLADFWRIAPQMPYVVKMEFDGLNRLNCDEIGMEFE